MDRPGRRVVFPLSFGPAMASARPSPGVDQASGTRALGAMLEGMAASSSARLGSHSELPYPAKFYSSGGGQRNTTRGT
eukprot:scaffold53740_cov68-Phaeocystis_antarctica.AAC.10